MSIVDWIYPKYCMGCREEGRYICLRCSQEVQRVGGRLRYVGVVRKIIKEIKYRGSYDMVRELVDLWNPPYLSGYKNAVVTSVPMWQPKERVRGFNQAELIARAVARRWDLPYQRLLWRTRETKPMYGLTRAERTTNVRGVFSLTNTVPPTVIIIDDVWTTGATLTACLSVLRRGGVEKVLGMAVAG